jgi:hypothetical protein
MMIMNDEVMRVVCQCLFTLVIRVVACVWALACSICREVFGTQHNVVCILEEAIQTRLLWMAELLLVATGDSKWKTGFAAEAI